MKSLFSIAAIATLALACGCGKFFVETTTTTTTTSSAGCTECFFVGNETALTLNSYDIATGGTLSAPSSEPLTGAGVAVAVNPKYPFVYVATPDGAVKSFSIGTTGVLTANNNGESIISGVIASAMTVDPTGSYLLLLSGPGTCPDSTTSTCFTLTSATLDNTTGSTTSATLNNVTITTPVLGAVVHQLLFSPAGTTLYASLGVGGIAVYSFSADTLTAASTPIYFSDSTAQTSVNGLATDSAGAYLYAGISGTDGGLGVFSTSSGLTAVTGSPFTTGDSTSHTEYAVVVTGSYAYVSNNSAGTITGYATASLIAATSSTPDALTSSPYTSSSVTATSASNTVALAVDAGASYIIAINELSSPDINVFAIGTDGSLTSATTVPTDASSGSGMPISLAAAASGT